MADPDLQIRGWGGEGDVHPDPQIAGGGGGVSKTFFRPFRPQLGLRIRWGGLGPLGPSPGYPLAKQIYYCFGLHRFINSGKMKLLAVNCSGFAVMSCSCLLLLF